MPRRAGPLPHPQTVLRSLLLPAGTEVGQEMRAVQRLAKVSALGSPAPDRALYTCWRLALPWGVSVGQRGHTCCRGYARAQGAEVSCSCGMAGSLACRGTAEHGMQMDRRAEVPKCATNARLVCIYGTVPWGFQVSAGFSCQHLHGMMLAGFGCRVSSASMRNDSNLFETNTGCLLARWRSSCAWRTGPRMRAWLRRCGRRSARRTTRRTSSSMARGASSAHGAASCDAASTTLTSARCSPSRRAADHCPTL